MTRTLRDQGGRLHRNFESGRSMGHPRNDRLHSAEYDAQIVCRHFGDNRTRKSDGLRHRGNRFEVSQTPVRVAIA
jgi:hypothetical protein